jgi:xylulokinase
VPIDRLLLIGGSARSAAVRSIVPQVFGRPVHVPEPGEYVADGAARQAGWALSHAAAPPEWASADADVSEAAPEPHIREQYAAVRDQLA